MKALLMPSVVNIIKKFVFMFYSRMNQARSEEEEKERQERQARRLMERKAAKKKKKKKN